MKYFVIAGEASGDLHASNLIAALRQQDDKAEFCGLGGDLMAAQGTRLVRHYRDMAYMGFVDVVLHLRSILGNMSAACDALKDFCPDMVILVDYPSFNLKIAEYVKKNLPGVPVFYYIAPKLWAWKSWRIKAIKKYVDRVFSILPFEVEWFGQRDCSVDYVGNPCVDAVNARNHKNESLDDFASRNSLKTDKPFLALLAGSRVSEIKQNLPVMLQAAASFPDFRLVIAGAPSIDKDLYIPFIKDYDVDIVYGETYELLQQAHSAVVTSGTATLETALMEVPQVVVYHIGGGKLLYKILTSFIKVKFISLVNLITDKEVVKELYSYMLSVDSLKAELQAFLYPGEYRDRMMENYRQLKNTLGDEPVSVRAARDMINTWREIRLL